MKFMERAKGAAAIVGGAAVIIGGTIALNAWAPSNAPAPYHQAAPGEYDDEVCERYGCGPTYTPNPTPQFRTPDEHYCAYRPTKVESMKCDSRLDENGNLPSDYPR